LLAGMVAPPSRGMKKGPAGAGPSTTVQSCSDADGEKPRHKPRVATRSESPCR
jgi:hypothetical protein